MQQMFRLRTRAPRQQLLGSRSVRMLSGDLVELEREMAKLTTGMFEKTGWSYPWGDVEDEIVGNEHPTRRPPQETHFPRETASIWSRIEDRRRLLGQLMSRSSSWERDLSYQLGGVSFLRVSGGPLASAMGADSKGVVMLGSPANPWTELDRAAFPFREPIFSDALYGADVGENDVSVSRDYRDFRPWLFNDLDETKVAQWHHDLTGLPPWPKSFTSYRIACGDIEEGSVPLFRQVKLNAQRARESRSSILGLKPAGGPSQPRLW